GTGPTPSPADAPSTTRTGTPGPPPPGTATGTGPTPSPADAPSTTRTGTPGPPPPGTATGTRSASTRGSGPRAHRPGRRQLGLATRHQLTAAGVPTGTVTSRTRPGGPWQRLLPRVYLLQTGPPDPRQRALAAVLYAAPPDADPLSGDTAALTGGAALALLGVREAPHTPADVLIRAPRRLAATGWARPLPTSRWPRAITVAGIPCTRPVRAAADYASRGDQPPDRVRSVLAHVVQAGWCHPHDLHAELRAARLLRRPAVRAAAEELLAGVRSVAEARARDALTASDLPAPLWNARLHTPGGAFLATPDAYWPEAGVALEIDSAEYHYTRDAWQATLRRRLRLEAHGILVVSATPSMIRDTPHDVLAALRALLALATARPAPPTARARGHRQLTLPF
ncbi:hypothetical protein AB0P12_32485, partial [Streptomyces subrutilus]|uniref:hypothetical protein n=1 Tax=Streptomyces subrutilus TaxID=36818 RepID=UPI0034293C40